MLSCLMSNHHLATMSITRSKPPQKLANQSLAGGLPWGWHVWSSHSEEPPGGHAVTAISSGLWKARVSESAALSSARGWLCCPDWSQSLKCKVSIPNCTKSEKHPPVLLAHANLCDNLHKWHVLGKSLTLSRKSYNSKHDSTNNKHQMTDMAATEDSLVS